MLTLRDDEFATWVVARRPMLVRRATMLCGDPHLAEDLVQGVLAKAYADWTRISRMESLDAYVRRALINAHIDLTRRPWWRLERLAPNAELTPEAEPALGMSGGSLEDRDAIVSAVLTLPPGMRRVVVLRFLWDLSVEQTANELDCTTGTVKSQTSKALARLASVLSPAFLSERG